jgi:hypothetical protein
VSTNYSHWVQPNGSPETKSTMRKRALDLFERLLKKERDSRSFPQDGSRGQAEAYHACLLESLGESDAIAAVGMVLDAATEDGHELSDTEICDSIDWEWLRRIASSQSVEQGGK